MKNHMVAPSVVARNLCLKPGRCGLNPEPYALHERVSAQAIELESVPC